MKKGILDIVVYCQLILLVILIVACGVFMHLKYSQDVDTSKKNASSLPYMPYTIRSMMDDTVHIRAQNAWEDCSWVYSENISIWKSKIDGWEVSQMHQGVEKWSKAKYYIQR